MLIRLLVRWSSPRYTAQVAYSASNVGQGRCLAARQYGTIVLKAVSQVQRTVAETGLKLFSGAENIQRGIPVSAPAVAGALHVRRWRKRREGGKDSSETNAQKYILYILLSWADPSLRTRLESTVLTPRSLPRGREANRTREKK